MKKLDEKWLSQLPFNKIEQLTPVSGGDINDSYSLLADNKKYFMKVQPNRGKKFFEHEAQGIHLLSKATRVPHIIQYGQIEEDGFLIQDWINVKNNGNQYELGKMVANVHKIHNSKFGLDNDFDLGKIPKNNKWNNSWTDFYIEQRLNPLVNMAQKNGLWNDYRQKGYEKLKNNFISDFNERDIIPSLLHGDLWSGNFMFNEKGLPLLIDPDVFYGDREMDIGITTVFGGFNEQFYQGYNEAYPLEQGWQQRLIYYQFYYLMAHLNMFGETYGFAVDNILNKFI
ncbi:fructosamine kinase family protein [Apilactobacillus timberlakei]|uniref:fructosamine kinase family protein n=1 Tax=Apilactobacillus timberlakei TaxID=2008380 RepID=UPI00112EEEF2|nr:fructosamine kinase family protein [Apilactobacillus timberlakei]TPR23955.1 fructosamine kinase family protein [Apilactobacillus timberlakei]